MKRELKVMKSVVDGLNMPYEIAKPIPMKRELKVVYVLRLQEMIAFGSQSPSR